MAVFTSAEAAAWLSDYASVVSENADLLTDLDRQIGDADHGANMDRGMKAVAALSASDFDSAAAYLKKAGMTLVSTVGGASGPLYGTFFMRFAGALPDSEELSTTQLAAAWRAGLGGVETRGHASVGEKTMVDALSPAVDSLESAEADTQVGAALQAAASAAEAGRDSATPLVATKGRASYLGERSAGHQDPGATSMTMLIESAARTLS